MTAIRITTTFLTVVMFVMIVVSMATGDFSAESDTLLGLAWGRMSLVDLYVGIALLFGWVVIREERFWVAIAWLAVFIVLGNAGTALYAAIASFRSPDVQSFLLGRHA